MKKLIGILALLLACLGLCSCTEETQESGTYLIYYTNEAADQLTQQEYTPQQVEGEELLWELLSRMKNPEVLTVKSAIPQKVEVSQLQLQDGHLSLDFNSPYKELDNVAEVLLRAAVVQTLIQVPQVEDIRFTVEGAVLYDISGIEIGAMDEDTFIDTQGEGINSYQYASLSLYFSDASGEKLVREMRNVHYSSNNSLEKVVVEQLLSGPANSKLSPVINGSAKILNVSIEGNTCILNFDKAFNQAPVNSASTPQTSIYAIVNSICDACDVSRVEIQIEGSREAVYRDEIGLDQKFRRKADLIEQVAESDDAGSESQAEAIDPAVGVESLINGNTGALQEDTETATGSGQEGNETEGSSEK